MNVSFGYNPELCHFSAISNSNLVHSSPNLYVSCCNFLLSSFNFSFSRTSTDSCSDATASLFSERSTFRFFGVFARIPRLCRPITLPSFACCRVDWLMVDFHQVFLAQNSHCFLVEFHSKQRLRPCLKQSHYLDSNVIIQYLTYLSLPHLEFIAKYVFTIFNT